MPLKLVALGRFTILAAAILTVVRATLSGWFVGLGRDQMASVFNPTGGGAIYQIVFGTMGFLTGLVVAGSFFGLGAAIFSIEQSFTEIKYKLDQIAQGQPKMALAVLDIQRSMREIGGPSKIRSL